MKRAYDYLKVTDILKFQAIGLSVNRAVIEKLQLSTVAKEMLWDEYDKFCKSLKEQYLPFVQREIEQGNREHPLSLEGTLNKEVEYILWNYLDTTTAREWTKNPNTSDTGKWCTKGKFNTHAYNTYGVAFHPNGWLLASVDHDGKLKIWDIYSEEELRNIEIASGTATVQFSPDGKLIAIGGYKSISLRDKYGRNKIGTLNGHTDWVRSVSFNSDSKLLASGSDDGTVRIWDLASQQELRSFKIPSRYSAKGFDPIKSVSFSPDGRLVAAGGTDGIVRIWDLFGKSLKMKLLGPLVHEFKGHRGGIQKLTFCLDGNLLVAIDALGVFKTWNLTSGKSSEIDNTNLGCIPVTTLAISPFNEFMAVSWTDCTNPKLLLVDPNTHRVITKLTPPYGKCNDMCFSPNGRYLAVATNYDSVCLLQIQTIERSLANCELSHLHSYHPQTTFGFLGQLAELSGQSKVKEVVSQWFNESVERYGFDEGSKYFINIAKKIWQVSGSALNWDVMVLQILANSAKKVDGRLINEFLDELLSNYTRNMHQQTEEIWKWHWEHERDQKRDEYLKILGNKAK